MNVYAAPASEPPVSSYHVLLQLLYYWIYPQSSQSRSLACASDASIFFACVHVVPERVNTYAAPALSLQCLLYRLLQLLYHLLLTHTSKLIIGLHIRRLYFCLLRPCSTRTSKDICCTSDGGLQIVL